MAPRERDLSPGRIFAERHIEALQVIAQQWRENHDSPSHLPDEVSQHTDKLERYLAFAFRCNMLNFRCKITDALAAVQKNEDSEDNLSLSVVDLILYFRRFLDTEDVLKKQLPPYRQSKITRKRKASPPSEDWITQ
jgi:hypothetical protein